MNIIYSSYYDELRMIYNLTELYLKIYNEKNDKLEDTDKNKCFEIIKNYSLHTKEVISVEYDLIMNSKATTYIFIFIDLSEINCRFVQVDITKLKEYINANECLKTEKN